MKYKIVFSILVIVIIAVTVFFFFRNTATQIISGETISETKEEIIAQVNGIPITLREVKEAQEYVQAQTGKTINETEALKRVISEKLILDDAEKHGFTQTIEETEKEISKILAGQNQTLKDFKKKAESREDDYEKELESYRQQFLINKYLNQAVVKLNVTEAQTFAYYSKNKDKMFTGETAVPYEQISGQLKLALEKQQGQQAISEYLTDLHENANIVYLNK